jgi:uncharacterized circularly permuted ATP-grasp superfamily protein
VSALSGYRSRTFDDAVTTDGAVRPFARPALEAVLAHDLAELAADVRSDTRERGIRFESVDGDDSWHLDPVPRAIAADDWDALAAGLGQRLRALNAFIADVYDQQRIFRDGVIPRRVLRTAEYLEPAMMGHREEDGVWVTVAGFDVVRDGEGRWMVLEDNLRTPSGFAYWWAARETMLARLTLDGSGPEPIDELVEILRQAFGGPGAVVLTDGPGNSAFWEHQWTAERIGVPLVVSDDLEVRDGRLWHRGSAVSRVYRRSDQDALDTDVGRLLHGPLRAGTLKVLNGFGVGAGDDKLVHAYVEEIVRYYLGEEPLVPSVETFDLGVPEVLERALDVFDELVVKDRDSYGGTGVVVCPHAEPQDVAALREKVRAAPGDFIAQRLVPLSTHPTIVDGRLEPRHIDLRPFVFQLGPDDVRVPPGGITRVALDEGALVVNSSQNGGAKDTWVVAPAAG